MSDAHLSSTWSRPNVSRETHRDHIYFVPETSVWHSEWEPVQRERDHPYYNYGWWINPIILLIYSYTDRKFWQGRSIPEIFTFNYNNSNNDNISGIGIYVKKILQIKNRKNLHYSLLPWLLCLKKYQNRKRG